MASYVYPLQFPHEPTRHEHLRNAALTYATGAATLIVAGVCFGCGSLIMTRAVMRQKTTEA